jgi:hypothetical protein
MGWGERREGGLVCWTSLEFGSGGGDSLPITYRQRLLPPHNAHLLPHAEEHPRQIDRDHALPLCGLRRAQLLLQPDARSVDRVVDAAAQRTHRLLCHCLHGRLVRHIDGDSHGAKGGVGC